MKAVGYEGYLTEEKLGIFLKEIFPGLEIKAQYNIRAFGKLCRIDYYIPQLNMFIEYNGDRHYNDGRTMLRDIILANYCKQEKINLVEIPYWLQIEDETFLHLFGEIVYDSFIKGKVEIPYAFPHGFISKTCILPANFSQDGWNKFWKEYGNLSSLDTFRPMRDVFESLVKKIDDLEIQRVMGIDLGDPEEPGPKAFFLGNYPT